MSDRLMEAFLQEVLVEGADHGSAYRAACDAVDIDVDGLDEDDQERPVRNVATFEEALVLSSNRGVVVTLHDGSEYQLTVVQSRPANPPRSQR